MRTVGSRACAGGLLAVLAATLLFPVAAFARAAPRPASHGCHCPVKMACCDAGLCHADVEDRSPGSGPSWSGCRDAAPNEHGAPPPSTALDFALLPDDAPATPEAASGAVLLSPAAPDFAGPGPATPPPRTPIGAC